MSGVLKLGSTTLGTENNGKIDLTNVGKVNEMNLSSTNHTWTVKAIDEAIVGATNNTKNDADSGQLAIYNGTTKLWGITENGYVVNPKLPYFKARKSAAINTTGYVPFDKVIYNNENFYNYSNGYATAPVAGWYQFFCKINAYNRIDFYFSINGGGGPETNLNYAEIGQYNTDGDNVGWWSNLLQTPLYLSAGDYVQVYVNVLSQNSDPDMWTHFSGYLIG